MKKVTDYKIRIGDKLDYVEYESNERLPVIITNMIFDGFVFLIEFKHEDDRVWWALVKQNWDELLNLDTWNETK